MDKASEVIGPLTVRRHGYTYQVQDAGQHWKVLAIEFTPDDAVARAHELAPNQADVSVDLREESQW